MRIRNIYNILLFQLVFFFTACSEQIELTFDKKDIPTYESTLKTINETQYVPHYRMFLANDMDLEHYGLTKDLNRFLNDSTQREKALSDFQKFDRKFIHWLLSFEKETTPDKAAKQSPIWTEYISPYSSKMSICNFKSSRAEQAMNVMYAWLQKDEIKCLSCPNTRKMCVIRAFKGIKSFLKNTEKDKEDLKKLWSQAK